jgi:hypothetical protein
MPSQCKPNNQQGGRRRTRRMRKSARKSRKSRRTSKSKKSRRSIMRGGEYPVNGGL